VLVPVYTNFEPPPATQLMVNRSPFVLKLFCDAHVYVPTVAGTSNSVELTVLLIASYTPFIQRNTSWPFNWAGDGTLNFMLLFSMYVGVLVLLAVKLVLVTLPETFSEVGDEVMYPASFVNCEMLWFANKIVPVEVIVMSELLVYFRRLRNTCADEVVTDDCDEVGTTLKVTFPDTPFIAVDDPALTQPPDTSAHGTCKPAIRGAIVLLDVLMTQ
jgi:hypothetical protein